MAIEAKDLNPRESKITLKGKDYILDKFSLRVQVWVMDEFATLKEKNGLINLATALKDFNTGDFGDLFRLTHYLLKDKSDFPTKNSLMDAVENDGKYHKLVEIHTAICECLGTSQPQMDEIYNELEAKKSNATARVS